MEQARYEVRTPMGLWLTNGLFATICILVLVGQVGFEIEVPGFLVLIAAFALTSTLAFWLSVSAYRVGGGRNLVRFYADRIEVPSPAQRQPLVFPREGTAIKIADNRIDQGIAFLGTLASVSHGKLITFRHSGRSRTISTLVLDRESDGTPLVADLQRFLAGEPALGRAGHAAANQVRSDYDDRLDRELASLD